MKHAFLAFCTFILVSGDHAYAQDALKDDLNLLIDASRRAENFQQLEAQLGVNFDRLEADGIAGYTDADTEVRLSMERARVRSQVIAKELVFDLDGDFTITKQELEVFATMRASQPLKAHGVQIYPNPEQIKALVESIVAEHLAKDRNGDGEISPDELLAVAEERFKENSRHRYVRLPGQHHDLDGDGRITKDEFLKSIMELGRAIDKDQDGTLSNDEITTAYELEKRLRIVKP